MNAFDRTLAREQAKQYKGVQGKANHWVSHRSANGVKVYDVHCGGELVAAAVSPRLIKINFGIDV